MRIQWLAVLVIAGCSKTVDVGPSTLTKRISNTNDLDLLFVIDNSASTADKQTVFNQNFPAFMAALDAFPGGRPNLHVGVVTSTVDIRSPVFSTSGCPSPDPDEDGLLQNTAGALAPAGCPVPTGQWISDIANPDGTRTTNYTGELSDVFSCLAAVGTGGCGFEAQLEGMKRALSGYRPENAGFLRADAYLGIVILTDEDDCSTQDPSIFSLPPDQVGGINDFRCQPMFAYTCDTPITASPGSNTYTNCTPTKGGYLTDPTSYVEFLASIKEPSQTVVALIDGDPETTISTGALTFDTGFTQDPALLPSCTATINGTSDSLGRPGNRLDAFRAGFEPYEHGIRDTVCQSDYSSALTQIGDKLFTMMSNCLEGAIDTTDTEPSNPGLQPACQVTMRVGFGSPDEHDVSLQACTMLDATTPDPTDTSPCWWVEPSTACATDTSLALEVVGESTVPGTVVDATCKTQH